MYNKDGPGRPPKFKVPLRSHTELVESQRYIFETRLVPIGDPDMKVEWYKDGKLLRAGQCSQQLSCIHITLHSNSPILLG
jgi:hypothetical protein